MEQFLAENWWIILLTTLWTAPWKGVALWKAAKKRDTIWFIILLVVNTMAVLEIIYVFWISKRKTGKDNLPSAL